MATWRLFWPVYRRIFGLIEDEKARDMTICFKKPLRIVLVTALSLGALNLSGCSYLEPYKAPLTQGNVMTNESIKLLQTGLTKGQVRQLLGPPLGQNPFNPRHWEYLYYSSEQNSKTKEHTRYLVLKFDQDQLLESWQEKPHQVQLKKDDSFLGLGWF